MSGARAATVLAWAICGLSALMAAAALAVAAALGHLDLLFMPSIAIAASFAIVGAVIASRRRANPIGWLLCFVAATQAAQQLSAVYAGFGSLTHGGPLPGAAAMLWLWQWLWAPGLAVMLTFILLLFPDGHPPSPRWRPVAWVAVAVIVAGTAALALSGARTRVLVSDVRGPAVDLDTVFVAVMLLFTVLVLVALASVVVRYRAGGAEERRQLEWVLLGAAALIAAFVPDAFLWTQPGPWDALVSAGVLAFPVTIAVAILRYRLYDIDVVINRSLVFAALAVFITAVYVGIVVGVGQVAGSAGRYDLPLSVVATGTVAVAFEPVRERAQRIANRLVYGRRATPYEVMADFSRRMARALTVEETLPRMAEAAARGVGGAQASVRVYLPGGGAREVRWPPEPAPARGPVQRVPVLHQDEPVGEIAVVKPAGQPFTRTDRRLLLDLAHQAGLAFDNLRMTLQLQERLDEISAQADELAASRRRIVAAADEQRRRLELVLREGAERELTVIAGRLHQAALLLSSDPGRAMPLLEELRAEASHTLEGLRELARGVFPPLLADRGLVAAVTSHVRKLDLPVEVEADTDLASARMDPQIEAAAYFCCVEALRGVTGPAVVRLGTGGGALELSVTGLRDGGEGIALPDMRDRIAACDGSMEVAHATFTARIPLETVTA